jgi:hypothetical protein
MKPSGPAITPWVQPVLAMIEAAGRRGGFLVALPEYRPDLFREMADELGLAFVDFRAETMRPLGWEAGRLPLTALTRDIEQRAGRGGLVVHNAEALLAAKTAAERRQWLQEFTETAWPAPVVIPITVFQADLPIGAAGFHRVDPEALPDAKLLTRLATQ